MGPCGKRRRGSMEGVSPRYLLGCPLPVMCCISGAARLHDPTGTSHGTRDSLLVGAAGILRYQWKGGVTDIQPL